MKITDMLPGDVFTFTEPVGEILSPYGQVTGLPPVVKVNEKPSSQVPVRNSVHIKKERI